METEVEQRVRTIIGAVYSSASDWTIVDVGDITIDLPPHEETMDEMLAAGHSPAYRHYQPGDDMYITIGVIHLRRPVVTEALDTR